MMRKTSFLLLSFSLIFFNEASAEDGYRLWLRYDLISNQQKLVAYRQQLKGWMIEGNSPTLTVTKSELQLGLEGLLGLFRPSVSDIQTDGIVVAGTPTSSLLVASLNLSERLKKINREGFIITHAVANGKKIIVIAAPEEVGVLYGVFHFLRLLQTQQEIENISIDLSPKTDRKSVV